MKKLKGSFFKVSFFALLTILTSMQTQAAALNYTVIDSSLIRVKTPTNLVIRTQTDWQNFYTTATSDYFPQPTAPSIDFRKVVVVVVASGEKSTGGYQTLISRVFDNPATTTTASYIGVQSVLINPGSGCFVSLAFTYPAALFTVPKTTKPFVFNSTGNVYKNCI